ncbi:MAG: DUF4365 domain-containing protein [Planctomycetia bacterium]|nr:DUF4365 domain-containing protein [Planctomycetia bacterium]
MSTEKEPWFVADRSEALAGLLLTSRNDVRVRSEQKQDDGADFFLEINKGEDLSTRLFVVQVKGTASTDQTDWTKTAKQLFRPAGSQIYLPACVFVINVRDNRAAYAWLAEPLVQEKSAKLQFHETGSFHDLNESAVNEIVDRVNAWYDALPHQLQPA